jgi:hypothetical protein
MAQQTGTVGAPSDRQTRMHASGLHKAVGQRAALRFDLLHQHRQHGINAGQIDAIPAALSGGARSNRNGLSDAFLRPGCTSSCSAAAVTVILFGCPMSFI